MKPYIEDRNGTQYEFTMTRKIFVKEVNRLQNLTGDLAEIENVCFEVLKGTHVDLTREQFDDILDYNSEIYGVTETYELLSAIIQTVFTQVDSATTTHNAFLQEFRANNKNKQEIENQE